MIRATPENQTDKQLSQVLNWLPSSRRKTHPRRLSSPWWWRESKIQKFPRAWLYSLGYFAPAAKVSLVFVMRIGLIRGALPSQSRPAKQGMGLRVLKALAHARTPPPSSSPSTAAPGRPNASAASRSPSPLPRLRPRRWRVDPALRRGSGGSGSRTPRRSSPTTSSSRSSRACRTGPSAASGASPLAGARLSPTPTTAGASPRPLPASCTEEGPPSAPRSRRRFAAASPTCPGPAARSSTLHSRSCPTASGSTSTWSTAATASCSATASETLTRACSTTSSSILLPRTGPPCQSHGAGPIRCRRFASGLIRRSPPTSTSLSFSWMWMMKIMMLGVAMS